LVSCLSLGHESGACPESSCSNYPSEGETSFLHFDWSRELVVLLVALKILVNASVSAGDSGEQTHDTNIIHNAQITTHCFQKLKQRHANTTRVCALRVGAGRCGAVRCGAVRCSRCSRCNLCMGCQATLKSTMDTGTRCLCECVMMSYNLLHIFGSS
jgi:hypothetical protein